MRIAASASVKWVRARLRGSVPVRSLRVALVLLLPVLLAVHPAWTLRAAQADEGEAILRPSAVRAVSLEGEPLKGAMLFGLTTRVDERPLFGLGAKPLVRADAEGWMEVPAGLEPEATLVVWVEGNAAMRVPSKVGRVDVALPQAEVLSGRVRFAGLAEAADVEVFALPTGRERQLAHRTYTLGDGSYRLDALEAGAWRLFLRRPDGRLQPLGLARAGQVAADVLVEVGVSAVGRLIDEDAGGTDPVAGVRIRLEALQTSGAAGLGEGTSDANGRFVVLGLTPGVYRAVSADPLWDFAGLAPRVEILRTHATPVGPWFIQRRQRLQGRVKTLEGAGVRGALVRLFREVPGRADLEEDALRVEAVRTDESGAYVFPRVRPGSGYRIVVSAEGYAPLLGAPFVVKPGLPRQKPDTTIHPVVALDEGLDLELRVRDGVGEAVPEATVLVMPARHPDGEGHVAWSQFMQQATTDAEGRVRFSALPKEGVLVRVRKAGWFASTLRVPEPTTGHFGQQNMTLLAGAVVRGSVTFLTGRAAEGYRIRAVDAEGRDVASGRTDAKGAFRFAGLRPIATDFEVLPPDSLDDVVLARSPGVLPGTVADLALTIPVLRSIEGLITGIEPEGPTTRVLLDATRYDPVLDRFRYETVRILSLTPDPTGSAVFTITDLPPGAYALRAVQGGRDTEPYPLRLHDEDAFDLRLPLPYPAKVAGSVVDVDGDAVAGAAVRLERVRADGDVPFRPTAGLEDLSGDSGAFSMPEVSPGVWRLVIEHPAFAPHKERLRVEEGDVLVLEDIVLGAGGVLEGRVTTPAGTPLEGAAFTVRPLVSSEATHHLRTGYDGRFRVPSLRAGTYVVRLKTAIFGRGRPDVLVEIADGETTTVEIGSTGRGVIEGAVTLGTERLGGAVLELVGEAASEAGSGAILRLRTVADASGEFRWADLPAGEFTVRLLHGTAALETDVTLGPLDRVSLDLEASTARIQGTARMVDGAGIPGATIEAYEIDENGEAFTESFARTRTDGRGLFELTGLPVGSYILQVDAPGLAPGPFVLAESDLPGADRPVELVLGHGGTLDIGVGDTKNRAVRGARVWLEDLEGRALHRTPYVVGPEGRIRIDGVPARQLAVRIEAPSYGTPARVQVDMREGIRVPVRVQLQPASRLRLVVAGLGPDPVTRARIDVSRVDTGEVVARRLPLRRLRINPRWGHVPRTGVILIEGLRPGRYAVVIDGGAAYGTAEVEVEVPAASAILLPVVLQPR